MKLRFRIVATTNSSLIGNNNRHTCKLGTPTEVENAIDKSKILYAINIVPFFIDNIISVEKQYSPNIKCKRHMRLRMRTTLLHDQ